MARDLERREKDLTTALAFLNKQEYGGSHRRQFGTFFRALFRPGIWRRLGSSFRIVPRGSCSTRAPFHPHPAQASGEGDELEQRLRQEQPAILNWALEGLARLTENDGKFTRLPAADEAIVTMRDLASPVAAFVRERCEINPTHEVSTETLFSEYKAWCELTENRKASREVFGRDLRAAVPAIRKVRAGTDASDRHHVYRGLALKEEDKS
jgi:phage/plasmid-associated DNA primase